MKTKEEIEARIEQIRRNPKMQSEPATVDTNGPLALIQCNMEGQISALEWVLRDD